MIDTLALARALLDRRSMDLRILVSDISPDGGELAAAEEPCPATDDERAAAAAIVDLLCERSGVAPPDWVANSPSLAEPRFVLVHAEAMPRLRRLCREESPPALRRRGFLAPPDFLTTA